MPGVWAEVGGAGPGDGAVSRRRKAVRVVRRPRFENPELFPAWIFAKPPDGYDAVNLRGGPVFEVMAEMGLRVQVIEAGAGDVRVEFLRPWTYVYLPVPADDCQPWVEGLPSYSSVIMDCHFPIMNMETAIGTDRTLIDVIDNKDTLLANLAAADVVTVPKETWAADLSEVNPNVFLLPDLRESDQDPSGFIMRLSEIAQASIRVKQARLVARREMGL